MTEGKPPPGAVVVVGGLRLPVLFLAGGFPPPPPLLLLLQLAPLIGVAAVTGLAAFEWFLIADGLSPVVTLLDLPAAAGGACAAWFMRTPPLLSVS